MTKIEYRQGDATQPIGKGKRMIVHICNDIGGWGRGFVVAISNRWKTPEAQYRLWYKNQNGFELGAVQFVQVEEDLFIANMIAQHKIKRTAGKVPIRYEALGCCLEKVAEFAKTQDISVHMPRIGCGLAGGTWEAIEPIIAKTLLEEDIKVTVYDFS